jgi:hypothetical protein
VLLQLLLPLETKIRDPSCATAFGARYASQQVSSKGRKYLQSQRLRRFLGEYPGITTIRKPLFMHGKTYSGSLNKLRHIEANRQSRKYKSKRLTERTLKPTNSLRPGARGPERALGESCNHWRRTLIAKSSTVSASPSSASDLRWSGLSLGGIRIHEGQKS